MHKHVIDTRFCFLLWIWGGEGRLCVRAGLDEGSLKEVRKVMGDRRSGDREISRWVGRWGLECGEWVEYAVV